jgi:polyisoprenoid-binding protein YceI
MRQTIIIAILSIFFSNSSWAQQWKIAENHTIAFSNSDVSGVFKDVSGIINFDSGNLGTSKFTLKIKVESINTGNGLQNKHAKGDEWFNAEKYPEIEFSASKIEKTESGYKAIGILELHGVKKEISVPFTFVKKGAKGTFIAKFKVNRIDYGVGKKGNEVGETINITATIPVLKK